jgi:hypothetical protein
MGILEVLFPGGSARPRHPSPSTFLTFASSLSQRPVGWFFGGAGTFAFGRTLLSRSPIENGPPRHRRAAPGAVEEAIGAPTGLFSFYAFKGDLMRFDQAINAIDQ